MSDWVMLVPSIVFSKILDGFSEETKTKYKMTERNFSSVSNSIKDATFPFVYVHAMPAAERGGDLAGTTINAGLFSFQIDVYDNQTQNKARTVMTEVMRIMKSMRFEVISMPEFESTETHRCTARFRRMIGSGDII